MLTILAVLTLAVPASALDFDQNVTPDVIFGDGNANGFFTVFSDATPQGDTIELGLRGKVRFNESGLPESTFNSDGQGGYYFDAGIGTGQAFPTPTWAFEWTVNVDATGTGRYKLEDFYFELGLDYDPSTATNYVVFDPITPTVDTPFWDHAIGDNSTANGDGVSATNSTEYLNLLSQYYVAQQSWRYSWFDAFGTFDPSVVGVYDIYLKAYIAEFDVLIAETHIQISVGGAVANEDVSWGSIKSLYR